jgi:hypothetical protein
VSLERDPLSLASTIDELLERKSSGSGLESRDPDHATRLYPQKLALTSPTRGGRSVGIVRSETKTTELLLLLLVLYIYIKREREIAALAQSV